MTKLRWRATCRQATGVKGANASRMRPVTFRRAALALAISTLPACAGQSTAPTPPGLTPAQAAPATGGTGAAAGAQPLALEYQGQLCSAAGCLLSTVSALCHSPDVGRLLGRTEAVEGSTDTRATFVVVPAREHWDEQEVVRLANLPPFVPQHVWARAGSLPQWPEWCGTR